jgi:hypothetical protein
MLLRTYKLTRDGSRSIDFQSILKRIGTWRQLVGENPAYFRPGRKPTPAPRRAGPEDKRVPIRSVKGLQDLYHATTDFLMDTFGAKPFIPVEKSGRDWWITMGWSESNFVRSWVSVVDSENRDVSDWNRRRITNRDGTHTAVLVHDFHRFTRDRASTIRVWLPALGLAVLFTRGGINPQSTSARSFSRQLRCFSLDSLWQALELT